MRWALVALCLILPGAAAGEAPRWQVAADSRVAFVAYQSGAPVEGGFERFSAEIYFDPEDLAGSRVAVEIDTASVDSQSKDRDDAIRAAGLLDVAQWPTARFAASEFVRTGAGRYEARGSLTLRDVTLPVVLPFALAITEEADGWRAEAEGALRISRLDYGVGQGVWRDTSVVSGDVDIEFRILATRPRE
jgi:polyisoprenoid-binding protein YceI